MNDPDRLLTVAEVAKMLGLASGTVYHFASEAKIPTVRLSRRCLRFRLSAILRWLDDHSDFSGRKVGPLDRI